MHSGSCTKFSKLKDLSSFNSVEKGVFQCFQDKNYIFEGLPIYCLYNEIFRRECVDVDRFYHGTCDVNIDDDEVKQLFKSAYDVMFYI